MTSTRDNLYEGLNKTTLVPGTAAPGKRGKGIGFYCEACNLTYKDSIQYLDHLNSKQHLYATGDSDNSAVRATLKDVEARYNYLKEKIEQERLEASNGVAKVDLKARIEARRKVEEEEKMKKQRQRIEKRERKRAKLEQKKAEDEGADESGMSAMMGFSNFGTSKSWITVDATLIFTACGITGATWQSDLSENYLVVSLLSLPRDSEFLYAGHYRCLYADRGYGVY